MSVLKPKRNESSIEYIRLANDLFSWSVNFVSRLSARYSRLLSERTINLASEVLECCVKANSTYPSCYEYAKMREFYLIKAIGSLDALDVMFAHIYEILMLNPQGAFSKSNGKSVSEKEAVEKLDKMCVKVGEILNRERFILFGIKKATHDKVRTFEKDEKKRIELPEELEGQMRISDFEFELSI